MGCQTGKLTGGDVDRLIISTSADTNKLTNDLELSQNDHPHSHYHQTAISQIGINENGSGTRGTTTWLCNVLWGR